ncbi:MAG TPA: extracellular solute-binding protein [Gaiellaceae bacterium]|jgi:ABC-type glycerol-3-phosphate transport system substrate-binding protein
MTKPRWRTIAALIATAAIAGVAAGCGGDDDDGGASSDVSGTISVMGIWTGEEQESFEAVIAGFNEEYPDVTVNYTSAGDNLPTVLSTAVEGGNPPDVAAIAQPGLMAGFVEKGALEPLDYIQDAAVDNFGQSVVDTGSVDGTLYGLLWKANNKSTVWYNVASYDDAGVEAAETWDDFITNGDTIKASGLPAYSIAGADGWTLTDLFENIYLRTAGPEMYDQLSSHTIPWTDQSVKDALTEMAKVFQDGDNIAGGTSGALQTDFPTSVSNVFSESPKAAQVIEADFVNGVVETTLEPETGFNVFTFPQINDSPPSVVGAGNLFITFRTNPAIEAFLEYMTTPESAAIWAERGGFSSPNKNIDTGVYPSEILRTTAEALGEAEVFRFDLSDLQPAAFGATAGQGMWKLFQDFLQSPDDVDGIAQQLEDSAKSAFGS